MERDRGEFGGLGFWVRVIKDYLGRLEVFLCDSLQVSFDRSRAVRICFPLSTKFVEDTAKKGGA